MTERGRFYLERDRRTARFGDPTDFAERPVAVIVGDDIAMTEDGQLTVLALVNLLARCHRRLLFDIPPVRMLRRCLVPGAGLNEAAAELARQIDPFIQLGSVRIDDGPISIGIGSRIAGGLDHYIGFDRFSGVVGGGPVPVPKIGGSQVGAALAACMGAAAVFRSSLGMSRLRSKISLYNWRSDDEADPGPAWMGPIEQTGVLQIGAGGVGSCLNYWLFEFGVRGEWWIADADNIELHNTNRCMPFFARHAGWPEGASERKADVCAGLISATSLPNWYHDLDLGCMRPRVILPLANDFGARELVDAREEALLLHATTDPGMWQAQLHRHQRGVDNCIVCRMPRSRTALPMACSTAPISVPGGETQDAALPFMSATSGLLLAVALSQPGSDVLRVGPHNSWSLGFNRDRQPWKRSISLPDRRCPRCIAT